MGLFWIAALLLAVRAAGAADAPVPAPELADEIAELIATPDIKFGEAASSGSRPNVVFIVADDLGYSDIGPYFARAEDGSSYTPNLDRLAREGLLFKEGYANSAVCSPTRFALISGRYQYRYRGGAEEPISARDEESVTIGFPGDEPSIPKYLNSSGYRTALIGKWHLGYPPTFKPTDHYSSFFGFVAGTSDYFLYNLLEDDEPATETGYLTDVLSRRAVGFLDNAAHAAVNGTEPFYLSLHYSSSHFPWESRDDREHAEELGGTGLVDKHSGSVETYRKMVQAMDDGIGQVLDSLDSLGLAEDTIVIFTSDNGGERFSDMYPFVGGKKDLTEGGIRVPWIVRWPGVVPEGTVTHQNAFTVDFVATILDAAGATVNESHPLDGVSILSVFEAPNATFERPLFWRMRYNDQQAFRRGDWKYLKIADNEYLFNISADSRERANKATVYPELLDLYRAAYEAWDETVPPIPEGVASFRVISNSDFPYAVNEVCS